MGEQRQADQDGDGEARPTQAAAMVPLMGLPVIFQTTARSIRPPSSGRPGSRLKAATMRLEIISPASSTPGTVPGSTNCMPT